MKLIDRNYYLQKLIRVIGTPDIKIITGVRRCGKSKLLDSFSIYLEQTFSDLNLIKINFNLDEFKTYRTAEKLLSFISSRYISGKRNFLLIDEIQRCEHFEDTINSIYETGNFDIYLTGSNAFLSSSDLATLFVGRQYEIQVYPFSFTEYMRYYNLNDPETSFDHFFQKAEWQALIFTRMKRIDINTLMKYMKH